MRSKTLSEQDIVTQARTNLRADVEDGDVLRACEAFYLHGFPDEQSGDVEAPTGHFYRVHRWIVITDDRGFSSLETYDDEVEAGEAFDAYNQEYCEWEDDGA